MSKFWWIPISYSAYVGALDITNLILLSQGKPVTATGFWTSWWMPASAFVIAYASEWTYGLLIEKEGF